jgi:hypothetical protein
MPGICLASPLLVLVVVLLLVVLFLVVVSFSGGASEILATCFLHSSLFHPGRPSRSPPRTKDEDENDDREHEHEKEISDPWPEVARKT